ncbi:MAG: hypothetical protein AAF415_12210 [Pseudomonadota bacterium]
MHIEAPDFIDDLNEHEIALLAHAKAGTLCDLTDHEKAAAADRYLRSEWFKRFLDPFTLLWTCLRVAMLWVFDRLIGFGYRPLWAVGWSVAFILAGAVIFSDAHRDRAMVPNNPVLLKSEWSAALKEVKNGETKTPYGLFLEKVPDCQPFDPLVYSIDTFVPLVNLHQEPHWIPQVAGKADAWPWTRLYLWLRIAMGWVITALFAASLTGLVKREG